MAPSGDAVDEKVTAAVGADTRSITSSCYRVYFAEFRRKSRPTPEPARFGCRESVFGLLADLLALMRNRCRRASSTNSFALDRCPHLGGSMAA
jgi:hypothetical protein